MTFMLSHPLNADQDELDTALEDSAPFVAVMGNVHFCGMVKGESGDIYIAFIHIPEPPLRAPSTRGPGHGAPGEDMDM